MPSTPVIQIERLRKFYRGKHRGVDGLDLEVHEGEVFGFLGPNGAGKTTAIRILLDLIRADSGAARAFGLDARKDSPEIRRRTGYLPGELGFYDSVTAKQLVDYVAALRGAIELGIVNEITERLQIDLSRRVREYSKGNKQKLGILLAFLCDPELVILDEPTSGLDPLLQHELYEFIVRQSRRGRTVFMSSHVLSEVEQVCDRVGVIRDGRVVAVERIEALKARTGQVFTVDFDSRIDTDDLRAEDFHLPGVSNIELSGHRLSLHVTGNHDGVLKALSRHMIVKLLAEERSLEDVFLEHYQHGHDSAP